jgi:hypothetical protein
MPVVYADDQVVACEAILNYTFRSEELLLEALNTAGQGNPLYYLAEYGDTVADFIVIREWMWHVSTRRHRFVNGEWYLSDLALRDWCLALGFVERHVWHVLVIAG